MRYQSVLTFLPGYMFDGDRLVSTGIALPPTQHVHPKTGEIIYYVKPVFEHGGAFVGMYVRHNGIIDYLKRTKQVNRQDR
jgi:predicted rRNA methylase YqxC with S4 and FtsJ domains